LLIVSGCGGGGGGSSGSLDPRSPGSFETAEYLANGGLEVIEASSAYAAEATGTASSSASSIPGSTSTIPSSRA
jgi:hypothetical protein